MSGFASIKDMIVQYITFGNISASKKIYIEAIRFFEKALKHLDHYYENSEISGLLKKEITRSILVCLMKLKVFCKPIIAVYQNDHTNLDSSIPDFLL
jgi:hypothetical protein